MQSWLVEDSVRSRFIDVSSVASLVDAIGNSDPEMLARSIFDAVRPLLALRQCTVFAHEAERAPRLLSGASSDGPWSAFQTGALHAREFAGQDGLRAVIERRPATGPVGCIVVCRQRTDELPEGTLRSECMEQSGLVDRVSVLVRVGESVWLSTHLFRSASQGLFDDAEIESVCGMARLIGRCMARHYACDVDGVATLRGSVSVGVLDIDSRLTAREREVLVRILDGVTVNRIAEDLKLRPTTIATYRMRAYEKLGVTSRQELFAAMLRQRGGALDTGAAHRLAA